MAPGVKAAEDSSLNVVVTVNLVKHLHLLPQTTPQIVHCLRKR